MNDTIQTCEKCQGTMSRNPNKKAPNHPDWICDQVMGKCGMVGKTGKWFATGAWDKDYQENVAAVKAGNGNSALEAEQTRQSNISKNVDRKEEGIAWNNAKNNATLLVCHVNVFRMITNEDGIKAKIIELAHWLYNEVAPPFKG